MSFLQVPAVFAEVHRAQVMLHRDVAVQVAGQELKSLLRRFPPQERLRILGKCLSAVYQDVPGNGRCALMSVATAALVTYEAYEPVSIREAVTPYFISVRLQGLLCDQLVRAAETCLSH
jgi:hypothetical protein